MRDEPLIQVSHVVKRFGNVTAVNDVSFSVKRGCVVGFIGANGAGKSTTLRMLATLEKPDLGSIRVFGHDVREQPRKIRARLGWMPDQYGAYKNMTIADFLDFYARAYRLFGAARDARVKEIMEFTDLTNFKERLITQLSKGMNQRLWLAKALIHDPDLLMMDEPAAGLDPKARVEFKNLVRILASQGKTLLISSHILTELEQMCDIMLFIDHGQIIHHGSADALLGGEAETALLDIWVTTPIFELKTWAERQGLSFVEEHKRGARFNIRSPNATLLTGLLRDALNAGNDVYRFTQEDKTLEDVFVAMLSQKSKS